MKRRIGVKVVRLAISRAAHSTKAMVAAFALGTLTGLVLTRLSSHRAQTTGDHAGATTLRRSANPTAQNGSAKAAHKPVPA